MDEVVRLGLQHTLAGAAAADTIKREHALQLFTSLARAAAGGEWDVFLPAFERASHVKGIKLLLPAPNGFPMRYAYENAGLPSAWWPIFVAILETVHAILQETGDAKHGKRLRDIVLHRVFALPDVREIPHAAEIAQKLSG